MKCQKCGTEIPAGSKFCNECGAKIEQVALFKDSKPENAEPYKCEKCGKIIPSNSVFCPECHTYQKNNFKPTSDTEKSPDKKPIYLQSKFYVGILIAVIFTITTVIAIQQLSVPTTTPTEPETTEDSYYSYHSYYSDYEQETTKESYYDHNYDYYEHYFDDEDETEPPTEKPTEFEDTLTELYSDSDIAVYYSDTEQYPYSDDEADVHFYVKNKMGKSITIQADTVILDGRSYNNVVCSDPISAHSEGMIELTVEDCKNFNPSTVGADLIYFDTDTYDNDVTMNIVSKKVK